jgi:outer membrane protein
MKNVNSALHAVSLLAIAVLFFLVIRKDGNAGSSGNKSNKAGESSKNIAIAYFEMDTIEHNYQYIKDVQNDLKTRQQSVAKELDNTKKQYMSRVQQLQSKASTMSQQEGESAQAEINQMQTDLQQREARLTQELQEQQFKLMQDINRKIEDYLGTYNKDKKFSYIFSHSPGDFMYFKDSANNITNEILKGLNDGYKKP